MTWSYPNDTSDREAAALDALRVNMPGGGISVHYGRPGDPADPDFVVFGIPESDGRMLAGIVRYATTVHIREWTP